jgi:hypothetical protein
MIETHTIQPLELLQHVVMCNTLQCGWHRGMSLASAPAPVFVGQSIAHNGLCAYLVLKAKTKITYGTHTGI